MTRLLLITAVAGFAIAISSLFAGIIIRPAQFDLMRDWILQAAAEHKVTSEGKNFLISKADDLEKTRRAEENRYAFAYYLNLTGLLSVSVCSLVAAKLSKRPVC